MSRQTFLYLAILMILAGAIAAAILAGETAWLAAAGAAIVPALLAQPPGKPSLADKIARKRSGGTAVVLLLALSAGLAPACTPAQRAQARDISAAILTIGCASWAPLYSAVSGRVPDASWARYVHAGCAAGKTALDLLALPALGEGEVAMVSPLRAWGEGADAEVPRVVVPCADLMRWCEAAREVAPGYAGRVCGDVSDGCGGD